MKKIYFLFIIILINTLILAQSPQKFGYQAVVRDQNSALISNQKIGVKISILQGSTQGVAVYQETHNILSNENGLITLEIGTGKIVSGIFSAIDWSKGEYFIKNEIDPKGGENYVLSTVNQFISVPYAIHAKTAESVVGFSTAGKLPTVATNKVEEIVLGAPTMRRYLKVTHTVSDDGGETVLKRGFCIGENPNPTTAGKTFSNSFGSSVVTITDSIFELKSNQKYFIRAYAVNTKGTAYGNEMVINTMDVKLPSVSTISVNNINFREATFVGSLTNSGNQQPKIGFILGTKAGLNFTNADQVFYCDTISNFSKKITYLNHSTSYYVRAFAENSMGISYGNELNFSTLKVLKPNVQTISVDSVGYVNALVTGKVINHGGDSIQKLGVCIGTTSTPTVNDIFVFNNLNSSSTIQSIVNYLVPNTTYYARAYALNSAGESYGNAIKFNTLTLEVTTTDVKEISLFEAVFYGEVKNPNGINFNEKGFCYSLKTNPTNKDNTVINWNGGNAFSATASDLLPNSTYYMKAYVRLNNSYVYGNEVTFTTKNITLTTNNVINNKGIKANLSGKVSDSTLTGMYTLGFCLSTSINPTINDMTFWADNYRSTFQTQATGLKSNTLYYVRAYVKSNSNNTALYGNQVSFKTGEIKLPTISTDSINNIQLHTASLYSTVVDDGGDDITEKGYCVATHTNPTITDKVIYDYYYNIVSVSGLQMNTKYYVRAFAKNSVGISYGNELSFSTADLKVQTVSVSKITFASAEFKAKILSKPKNSSNTIYVLVSKKSNPEFNSAEIILADNWYNSPDSLVQAYKKLEPNTTYYAKAVLVNTNDSYYPYTRDTVYGSVLTFKTATAPVIQTQIPSKIFSNGAYLTGSNANSNGYLFTEKGFLISDKPGISYANLGTTIQAPGNTIGDFSVTADLEPNTTYYVKAFAKTNDYLMVFGNEFSFKTLSVGYKGTGGGFVFYDKGEVTNGWRYLEIAANDQSNGIAWGCESSNIYNSNWNLGGGFENTNNIITNCTDQNNAARLCYNLVLNSKTDWYLPNSSELRMAYRNLQVNNIGNFNPIYYWTSTSYSSGIAVLVGLSNGDTQDYDVKFTGAVRAVRRY